MSLMETQDLNVLGIFMLLRTQLSGDAEKSEPTCAVRPPLLGV